MKKRRVLLALIGVACFCILIFLSVGTQYGEWLDSEWQHLKYSNFIDMYFSRNVGAISICAFFSALPFAVTEIFFKIKNINYDY